MTGWIIFALFGALFVALIFIYNNLVTKRNRYKNAFAQIDVQLTRRHDLIPNLVKTAKGYMKHEKSTLEAVINARNTAVSDLQAATADPTNPAVIKKLSQAEQGLSGALGRLFALFEAYPDLKANQNMMQLSEELTNTENKVSFARQTFNDAVMLYNTACESFPANLMITTFGFKLAELLQIEEKSKREVPQVSFS